MQLNNNIKLSIGQIFATDIVALLPLCLCVRRVKITSNLALSQTFLDLIQLSLGGLAISQTIYSSSAILSSLTSFVLGF